MNAPSQARRENWQPLTLLIIGIAAVLVVFFRFVPTGVRGWNFVPAGALFLFAGARMRPGALLLLPFVPLLATDLYFYEVKGYPFPLPSYFCYGLYVVLGWALARHTESPLSIGAAALSGSILFFLVTNGAVWLGHVLHPEQYTSAPFQYAPNLAGLIDCYKEGLPFYRGTFLSDILFTAVFFGAHAVLSRAYFPAERIGMVPAQSTEVLE
jgi:hypothetical protein